MMAKIAPKRKPSKRHAHQYSCHFMLKVNEGRTRAYATYVPLIFINQGIKYDRLNLECSGSPARLLLTPLTTLIPGDPKKVTRCNLFQNDMQEAD